mmetsp:Transcript_311/g.508  ORF Transcript_311/g.508 Transcript_311/m.508 type:complete len:340 (-) Transcript_311:78-1097(-)
MIFGIQLFIKTFDSFFLFYNMNETACLLNLGVEDSLGKDLLGDLGSHIGVTKLGGNEDTSDFGFIGIDLVDFHFDTSLSDIEGLVVLLEKFSITFLSRLKTGKSDSHIVTGGSTTSLGVQEKTGTVRRCVEVTSHLETRLEGSSVTLGNKILDSEKEGNTFSSRKLDSGRGVIDTLLLGEDNGSTGNIKISLNTFKGVSLTGHNLGVDELLLGLSGLSDFFLDGPCLGLDAHIDKLGSSLGGDAVFTNNLSTTVGKASSLNLKVGKRVDLRLGQSLGGLGNHTDSDGTGKSSLSSVGNVILQGHLQSAGALGRGGRSKGASRSSKGEDADGCELHLDCY